MSKPVGDLIDQLRDESEEGVGFHSTAWAEGFAALDEKPRFAGGVLGSRRPASSPVLRELVARGVAALPSLLGHLDDARPTGLSVGQGGQGGFFFSAMWHADEYAPRHADPARHPPGVNTGREYNKGFEPAEPYGRKYTLRVGDLCYVAVGQIVNRSLNAVRYQPTGCLVINSPVQTPALAVAARADWAGLDADSHRQSLTADAFDRSPYAAPAALKRLCYYYPDAGLPLALRFLARPLVRGGFSAWEFVTTQLVGEPDPARWEPLIDEFRRREGAAAAEEVPCALGGIVTRPARDDEADLKVPAGRILTAIYPEYDPYAPPFVNAAGVGEQARVVEGLARINAAEIDAAAADVFRRALGLPANEYWERVQVDDLALACLPRLAGKGYDDEFRGWLADRVRAIEATPDSSPERYRLDLLRLWAQRLGPRAGG